MHGVLATRIKEEEGATFKFTHLLPSLSHRKAVLLRGILWWTSSGFTLSNIHLSNPHIIPKKIDKTNPIYIPIKSLLKILFSECLATRPSQNSTRKMVRNLGAVVGFWVLDLKPQPPRLAPGASIGNWTTPETGPDSGAQYYFLIPDGIRRFPICLRLQKLCPNGQNCVGA